MLVILLSPRMPFMFNPLFLFLVIVVGVLSVALFSFYKKWEKAERYRRVRHLHRMIEMTPIEFEKYVAWIFEKQGYRIQLTPRTGDHGIDILLHKDGATLAVQVKKYQRGHAVGEEEVREFFGSFAASRIARGIFVTTSRFTQSAVKWGRARNIALIDGEMLASAALDME